MAFIGTPALTSGGRSARAKSASPARAVSASPARQAGSGGFSPAVASTAFVEVGQASTSANITRGGVKLPDIAVNAEIVGSFLGDLHPIFATHIVSQSIPPAPRWLGAPRSTSCSRPASICRSA